MVKIGEKMKKRIFKLFTLILTFCALLNCVACGDKNENNSGYPSLFLNQSYPEKTLNSFVDYSREDTLTYLNSIKQKNSNPISLVNLTDGVMVSVWNPKEVYLLNYYTFQMFMREENGVLLVQGHYMESTNSNKSYLVNFYHDGTYLGVEYQKDAQLTQYKEEVSVENIGKLIKYPTLVTEVLNRIKNQPTLDDYIDFTKNNTGGNYDLFMTLYKIKGSKKCVKSNFVRLSMYNYRDLVLDSQYNIMGFQNYDNFTLEMTNQKIGMPYNLDKWPDKN